MNQITSEYQKAQELASSEGGRDVADGCRHCHDGNWIHLRYEYPDEQAVTDTLYVVQKPNGGEPGGEVIAEGVLTVSELSKHRYIHVDLGDYDGEVEVFFFDDPTEPVPFEEPAPVEDERNWLERAAESVASSIASGAEWTWGTLQGDFNENMSTSQIITNAIVTAVPVVDQVADLRDLIANSKLLIRDKRYDEIGVWVGVFACLIGLVPSLGSLAKGVIKIIWKNVSEIGRVLVYINKALHRTGMRVNGYRFVTKLADDVVDQVGFVSQKFDEFLNLTAQKVSLLKNLTPGFVEDVLETIEKVRGMASHNFEAAAQAIKKRILKATSGYATRAFSVLPGHSVTIRRVTDMVINYGPYRHWQKTMDRPSWSPSLPEPKGSTVPDNAEFQAFRKASHARISKWYDELLSDPDLPDSIRKVAITSPDFFKKNILSSFAEKPVIKPLGKDKNIPSEDQINELYRVIGKEENQTGGFWSRSRPSNSEAEWRRENAVRQDWNAAGAYVVAEVPPPDHALVGKIGPQSSKNSPGEVLPGGGEQVWLPGTKAGAVSPDQIKEYYHTYWNDRTPVEPLRSIRNAGKIGECDL
ncbi:hypothetical protein TH25_05350 [Thalassospira profundimaris]|uniref:Uncharacterized protein n=1 Tax=Thalassospira profundimaris TaxID=502049 RepID=A0A367XID9_9PROT|nr:hypothetical protein [Thalassospira profundimaris]RCK52472.1 hypothetical protein TH25_05350 [Thalassospira profundimaris]